MNKITHDNIQQQVEVSNQRYGQSSNPNIPFHSHPKQDPFMIRQTRPSVSIQPTFPQMQQPQLMTNSINPGQLYPTIQSNNPVFFPHFPYPQQQLAMQQVPLNLGLRTPEIQLSQRQIDLMQARNLQLMVASRERTHLTNGVPLGTQQQKGAMHTTNLLHKVVKQDPPDRTREMVLSSLGSRDPPTSINDTTVKGNDSANTATAKSDVVSSTHSYNSEQQRRFLRSILHKAGTPSVASSNNVNKSGKELVKRVLQKGASNLSNSKAKHTISKPTDSDRLKTPNKTTKETKSSGSTLRDRWFRRKGVSSSLADTVSITWTSSSSSKEGMSTDSQMETSESLSADPISRSRSQGSSPRSDTIPVVASKQPESRSTTQTMSKVETNERIYNFIENFTGHQTAYQNSDGIHHDMKGAGRVSQVQINAAEFNEPSLILKQAKDEALVEKDDPYIKTHPLATSYKLPTDKDLDEGYATFFASLQQEVFSGQFTYLWSSFAALLVSDDESIQKIVNKCKDMKPFKVDPYTKQILKELNHHAKRNNNVECMPRSQLVSDKKFIQEGFVRTDIKNDASAESTTDNATSTEDKHYDANHKLIQLLDASAQSNLPDKYKIPKPKLHVITSTDEPEKRNSQQKDEILIPEKHRRGSNDEAGRESVLPSQRPVKSLPVAPSTSTTSSYSPTWIEGREALRKAEASCSSKNGLEMSEIKQSPSWVNTVLRTESRLNSEKLSSSEPEWSKVTLRHVDNLSYKPKSANTESIDPLSEDKQTKQGSKGEGNTLSGITIKDNNTTSSALDEGMQAIDPALDSMTMIRLAGHSNQEYEGRVIVGQSTLIGVQSFYGESKALVQWKILRSNIKSMSLEMATMNVNLVLYEEGKTIKLDFGTKEDCLKFASSFYAMQNNGSSDECNTRTLRNMSNDNRNTSFLDSVDASMRLESLNDEEQNILETYRRLRQTKTGEEKNDICVISKPFVEKMAPTVVRKQNWPQSLTVATTSGGNKPPEYVIPPDLPSSPVSTFSNSICSEIISAETRAEKYIKMLRMKIPTEAVRHQMTMDNVDPEVAAIVFATETLAKNDKDFSTQDNDFETKYKKMLRLGLPEDVVLHKMKQDQQDSKTMIARVFEKNEADASLPRLTDEEEKIVAKFRNLLKIGIPKEAVQHKMLTEKVAKNLMDALFLDEKPQLQTFAKTPKSNEDDSNKEKLNNEEEAIASNYRKLLKLQIPKEAVLARMETEGISQKIITAVIRDPSLVVKMRSSKTCQEIADKSSASSFSRSNLISLHWNVLTASALPGSVWDKVTASDVSNGDTSELVELFQKKTAKSSLRSVFKSSGDSETSDMSKAKLLDLTRSNNISISLKAFKEFSYPELAEIIAFVNPLRRIQGERSQFVRDILPTPPEIKLIQEYVGPDERLAPAEIWFRQLQGVKRIETKARVIRTMEMFSTEVESVRLNFRLLQQASRQVIDSQRLQVLLQAVLVIGNKLNEGTKNGDAAGFRFDSLLRLTQTKAVDGKTTVLDYLVKEFAEKGQKDMLLLSADCPDCQLASRMLISDMTKEVTQLQKALDECRRELLEMTSENEKKEGIIPSQSSRIYPTASKLEPVIQGKREKEVGYSLSGGVARLSSFIESVEESFSCLIVEKDATLKVCKDLSRYSGESGGLSATTTVLSILSEFATNIELAMKKFDDNQRHALKKQKVIDSKGIETASTSGDKSLKSSTTIEKSLVLLVNDVLKNANPQFKEDFRKGRFAHNPSEALKHLYEKEIQVQISDTIHSSLDDTVSDSPDKKTSLVDTIELRPLMHTLDNCEDDSSLDQDISYPSHQTEAEAGDMKAAHKMNELNNRDVASSLQHETSLSRTETTDSMQVLEKSNNIIKNLLSDNENKSMQLELGQKMKIDHPIIDVECYTTSSQSNLLVTVVSNLASTPTRSSVPSIEVLSVFEIPTTICAMPDSSQNECIEITDLDPQPSEPQMDDDLVFNTDSEKQQKAVRSYLNEIAKTQKQVGVVTNSVFGQLDEKSCISIESPAVQTDVNDSIALQNEAVRKYLDSIVLKVGETVEIHSKKQDSTLTGRTNFANNSSIGTLLDPQDEDESDVTSFCGAFKKEMLPMVTASNQNDGMSERVTFADTPEIESEDKCKNDSKVAQETGNENKSICDEIIPEIYTGECQRSADSIVAPLSKAEGYLHGSQQQPTGELENQPNDHVTQVQQNESHVARMARLKREEKVSNYRKSSPLPQKLCHIPRSTVKTQRHYDLVISSPGESAMSKLARQKRECKRMSR